MYYGLCLEVPAEPPVVIDGASSEVGRSREWVAVVDHGAVLGSRTLGLRVCTLPILSSWDKM